MIKKSLNLRLQIEQAKYNEKIVTEIQPLTNYVLAEDYHQEYLKNNPGGYCHIDLSKIPREKPVVMRNFSIKINAVSLGP